MNFTSSTILLRVFKSSATAQEEQRQSLSLSSRRLPLTLTGPADRTHDESCARERWGRMAAAVRKPVHDRSNRQRTRRVSFFRFFWRLFSPFIWRGWGGGGLPIKLVWRLAFNIFGDYLSIFQSPTILNTTDCRTAG